MLALNRKTKKSKKRLLPYAVAVVVVVVGGLAFFYLNRLQPAINQPTYRDVNSVDYGPPSSEDRKETEQKKADILQKGSDTPAATQSLSIVINRADQASKGQPLNIRTTVTGTASGTCEAKLSQQGQATITAAFDIKPDATASTCNGDIPMSLFGTEGDWDLRMQATSGNTTSNTTNLTVKVGK